jgi:hypothetical protein
MVAAGVRGQRNRCMPYVRCCGSSWAEKQVHAKISVVFADSSALSRHSVFRNTREDCCGQALRSIKDTPYYAGRSVASHCAVDVMSLTHTSCFTRRRKSVQLRCHPSSSCQAPSKAPARLACPCAPVHSECPFVRELSGAGKFQPGGSFVAPMTTQQAGACNTKHSESMAA